MFWAQRHKHGSVTITGQKPRHIDGSSWVTSYGQSQAKRETQVLRGSQSAAVPTWRRSFHQARFDAPALAVALRV